MESTLDAADTAELFRLGREVAGLQAAELEERIDELELDRRAREVAEKVAKATKPGTGSFDLGGMRVTPRHLRAAKWFMGGAMLLLTALGSTLTYIGVGVVESVKANSAALAEASEKTSAAMSVIHYDIVALQAFAELGDRVTDKDFLPVAKCVLRRFEARRDGLKGGVALRPGDQTLLAVVEDCIKDIGVVVERMEAP